ncbi:putative methyltransferase-like protein 25 isoform X1 [Oculina patagonica]
MAASEISEEQFYKDFKRVVNYLEAQKQLMDAHMVDFFTSNHWETLLPRQIREDLESLSEQQLSWLPTACVNESVDFDNFGENLKHFLTEATRAQLKSFAWVKEQKEFASEGKVDFISHNMTPKKSYEVDVMSDVINRLVERFQVSKILDLGSGKGYLSQYLAMQYGLNVVGVDSSDSNTQNAAKRNERLLKVWQGLVKKSQKGKLNSSSDFAVGSVATEHLDSQTQERTLVAENRNYNSESLSNCCTCCIGVSHVCNPDDNRTDASVQNQAHNDEQKGSLVCDLMQNVVEAENKPRAVSEVKDMEMRYSKNKPAVDFQSSSPSSKCQQCDSAVDCKGSVYRNTTSTTCNCYLSKKPYLGHAANAMIPKSQQSQTRNPTSFVPVTGFVDQSFIANGELTRLFDELGTSNGVSTGCTNCNAMFLVGLHTCGDLAPMALRIFVNEPTVKVICIVGCCYHLVSQEFGRSDDACTADDPGFPMSQFLKPFRLHISRNATMVAQQAADRIATESKSPPPSVLYRAILQVILKEKFGLNGRRMHVGKAGSKCKDFKEYVHKCLDKLGLKDQISELSDEEVESYLKRYKTQERQLHTFHQLRATIAPCIESVFLLDRLSYLYEQGYKSACIVRLFDPVKSPRCYAIIASKI